jgi:serine/threonine-protein kinase RsbW
VNTHQLLRFPATREAFDPAFSDFRAALAADGVRGRPRHHAELVFEEVVSNIIRHGTSDGGVHQIEVSLARAGDVLVLTFDDDGVLFNPLEREDPVLPSSIDEATLGGLGVLLVRKSATRLHYERTPDQRNRLEVTISR